MHILIIPGEELNENNFYSSVFELNQADALANHKIKIGFISINLQGNLFTTLKNCLLLKKKAFSNLKHLQKTRKKRNVKVASLNLIEVTGCYYFPSALNLKYKEQTKAGLMAYKTYVSLYGKPDIIHAHSRFLVGGLIANEILNKFKIPYILTEHSSFYERNLVSSFEYTLASKVINDAKVWITVSPQLGNFIRSKKLSLNKTFRYVPNVLDSEFENVSLSHNAENSFTFIHIASLDDNKAQHILLKAFAQAFKTNTKYFLKIAGSGKDEQFLKQLSKELNIENQVVFLGQLSRDEIKTVLSTSNAFVLSSMYETFGVVLIEALAFGLPIIATKCGGPENIVNENNGYLVPVNDVEAFADAMKKMVANYSSFNLEIIRQDCLNRFGSKQFGLTMKSIYKEVLQPS
ncbi:MAG: glycosyltransferase [Chitinophagales bacterium]|nr:glycosyltransferase [Chitinophagales bacterium]